MSAESIKTVAVIGAGQMGRGIVQVFAASGHQVILFDADKAILSKAVGAIDSLLTRAIEKEKISQKDKEATLANIQIAENLSALKKADLVIEAIIENLQIKTELFKELDAVCPAQTVFASNTSSISITKLAAATKRADKFIGMHFMNPVPVMLLVEIIRGIQTSDTTYELTLALTRKIGKEPVTANHDYPGFIVNRILVPMINEAFYVLMEGIASPEDIDSAMKLGTNQPMGPLALADFVGLDTLLSICKIFHEELGDSKYRPCPLLVKYVEAGWYGKKTGKGVYTY